MKARIKQLAYHGGLLGALHRWRNRGQLTVAMFHRVLPASDARHAGADPEWTMTPDSFDQCLRFFKRHYRLVTPQQVFAALRGDAILPGRSMLVTFDDGWADTAEYAQPLLARHQVPALIFVAGCAVDSHAPFWEEHLYSVLATRAGAPAQFSAKLASHGVEVSLPARPDEAAIRHAIGLLGQQSTAVRQTVLASFTDDAEAPPAMMDQAQLRALVGAGLTVGGHGMQHVPLTKAPDVTQELTAAQACLSGHLQVPAVESMSFPHGAQSSAVISACRAAGYRYLFSSSATLVDVGSLGAPRAASAPVGRIHISEREIVGGDGRVDPARLATWLFLRPASVLQGAAHG